MKISGLFLPYDKSLFVNLAFTMTMSHLQLKIIRTNVKNGVVCKATMNFKTLLKSCVVRFKIIALCIYKELSRRSNNSRDDYYDDGYLVPSAPSGFSFEAAF